MEYKVRLIGAILQGAMAMLWLGLWWHEGRLVLFLLFVVHVGLGLALVVLPGAEKRRG